MSSFWAIDIPLNRPPGHVRDLVDYALLKGHGIPPGPGPPLFTNSARSVLAAIIMREGGGRYVRYYDSHGLPRVAVVDRNGCWRPLTHSRLNTGS